MQAAGTQVIDIKDAAQARKDRRAKAARERYAANKEQERERCRLSKQRSRGGDITEKVSYDADDYAEEWRFLTHMGMRSDQIIERSRPSRGWFTRWVRPLVHVALCASCGEAFNPQKSGMLTRCSHTCGWESGKPSSDGPVS